MSSFWGAVQAYQDPAAQESALKEQLRLQLIGIDAYTTAIKDIARTAADDTFTPPNKLTLKIKNIAAHYYLPLLLAESETIDYINHVIRVPSEVKFIEQLDAYIKESGNLFAAAFDWWMFSRADETLDRIFIPYYDSTQNQMREFHPDFIFWFKRFNDYFVLFVDPKGMQNTDYQRKIDGYKEIFTDGATGELKMIPYNDMHVRVVLAMHTEDANKAPRAYNEFWFDHPKGILQRLVAAGSSTGG